MSERLKDESLGQYIERLRTLKGYSQRKLAMISGVSNTTINRIENGDTPNPDANTLKLLAKALNVEETVLLEAAGYINLEATTKQSLTKRDLKQIERDLESMMKDIKENPDDGFAAYDGDTEIETEDLEQFEDAMRMALRAIKKINKQKYAPKKYKK